jgi:uncharacterized repeat protein (TIGR03803 family)
MLRFSSRLWIFALALTLSSALPASLRAQATENALHNFAGAPSDGSSPWGGLMQASDGNFYGVTFLGGANNTGTIFRITPGGTLTTLFSFPASGDFTYPAANLMEGQDGNLYGATCGNSTPTNNASVYGTLYQVAGFSGSSPAVAPVVTFTGTTGTAMGTCPLGALIEDYAGNFLGTTFGGGPSDYGTVFSYTPGAATPITTLYSFTGGTDGGNPFSGLIQGSNGNFFGVTSAGGDATACPSFGNPAVGCGVLFRVARYTNKFLVLHTFEGGSDGAFPTTQLTEGSDHYLYGSTYLGGANGFGVLFKLFPDGLSSIYTPVASLNSGNADAYGQAGPEIGPLFLAGDGNFYGSEFFGGDNTVGSVYSYTPGASTVNTFYSFTTSTGMEPYTAPVEGQDGNFYGPTISGGTDSQGTIYQLAPSTAVPPAITLDAATLTPTAGTFVKLTWDSNNTYSDTAQLCFLSSLSGTIQPLRYKTGATYVTQAYAGPATYGITCGGVESATVTVNYQANPKSIVLSSAGHNFGSVPQGTTATYGVQLTNNTTSAFPFSITLSGSPNFTQANNCPAKVVVGASCEIVFTYTAPATSEYDSATFTIPPLGRAFSPSNTGTLLAHSVAAGSITLNANKHNFGAVPFGSSASFGLILSNGSGQAVPLSFTPSGDTTDFAVTNNCPATIAINGSCSVIFTYTPSSTSYQTLSYAISTGTSGVAINPPSPVTLLGYGVTP